MRRTLLAFVVYTALAAHAQWPQWGRDPQHTGSSSVVGQALTTILADSVYDPFLDAERQDSGGALLAHFQAPLTDGDDVYMVTKSGQYTSEDWQTQTWNVVDRRWINGQLVQQWIAPTDWKPVPVAEGGAGPFFEPVFHPALTAQSVYLPAAGGTILRVDRATGAAERINPFPSFDPTIYVSGPLVISPAGDIYYNAMQPNTVHPWTSDMPQSWLVRVAQSGATARVAYSSLVVGAPFATAPCVTAFTTSLPWPPSPDAVPPSAPCGTQRPGVNTAPAFGSDGTVYVVSRAQFNSRYAYITALTANLAWKWTTSMRDRFNDGCNVLLPPNGAPGGCRQGAHTGVDPTDNTPGAGTVNDNSTSCPIVAPDGSVFYGAYTRYNYSQGHLMHFSATGEYLGAYPFGWDTMPAIWSHDQSYSLITKENHYGETGSYCGDPRFCPAGRTLDDPEQYFITRLSPSLHVEWQFKSTNTRTCERQPDGTIACVDDHPDGFEWCINAPAVDANGTTYVNGEDGVLYAIDANGHERASIFLDVALGAAYTPLSIDARGRIYTQNAGHLIAVGSVKRRSVAHP